MHTHVSNGFYIYFFISLHIFLYIYFSHFYLLSGLLFATTVKADRGGQLNYKDRALKITFVPVIGKTPT